MILETIVTTNVSGMEGIFTFSCSLCVCVCARVRACVRDDFVRPMTDVVKYIYSAHKVDLCGKAY